MTKKPNKMTEPAKLSAGKTKAKPAAKKPASVPRSEAARKAGPAPIVSTGYWLFKSEPDVFSWDDLVKKGPAGEEWNGVRNYLARNNMKAMALGDLGFFYHSNIGKEIVGICEVSALAHPDSSTDDPRWECVDVRAVCPLPRPVTLAEVKENAKLESMSLVTSMRLSVQPVTEAEWNEVCRMAGLDPKAVRTSSPRRKASSKRP